MLEHLATAAVHHRIALGPIAGRKTLTLQTPGAVSGALEAAKPLTAMRYRGLFAPNAKHRHHTVDTPPSPPAPGHGEQANVTLSTASMTWMQRATPKCSRSS